MDELDNEEPSPALLRYRARLAEREAKATAKSKARAAAKAGFVPEVEPEPVDEITGPPEPTLGTATDRAKIATMTAHEVERREREARYAAEHDLPTPIYVSANDLNDYMRGRAGAETVADIEAIRESARQARIERMATRGMEPYIDHFGIERFRAAEVVT